MQPEFGKTSFFHIILLFIMSVGLLNHVIIIPALIDAAKRDAWVSILCTVPIFVIWVGLIAYISKSTKQQNIYVWVKQHIGSVTAKIMAFAISFFLLSSAFVTMADMSKWTSITFLPQTPQVAIVLVFMLLCFLTANTSLLTITIINGILLPLVILLGYFVFAVNLNKKDYSLLLPILEHGFSPIMQGMIYSGAGLAEIFIIILLQHHLKTQLKYSYLVVLVIILAYLTFGPVTGSIAAFGPIESARQRFPAYELWSLVTLGRFVEHVDFFSIFQWLSGAFIRISLALYIIVDLVGIPQGWRRITALIVFSLLIMISTLLPFTDNQFLHFLSNYFLPLSMMFLLAFSFFLSAAVFIVNRQKKKRGNVH